MKTGKLIIFSGLPCSGKSTLASGLAKKIGATYLKIDTIEQALKDLCSLQDVEDKGYLLAHKIAQENLKAGQNVIADSVNPWSLTRNDWNHVAQEIDADFLNFEVICSDPSEHKKRAFTRGPSVPGAKVLTWQDITQRDYHPWEGKRHQVDTAGKTVEQSLVQMLEVLKQQRFITEDLEENLKS